MALGILVVLQERIELSTSPLPRECSTTELLQRDAFDRATAAAKAQDPSTQGNRVKKRSGVYSPESA